MRISDRKRTTAGDKTICLPLPEDLDYERWIENSAGYRQYLDEQIAQHPELFSPEIEEVEKGLYLKRCGVPYEREGISQVLGHNPMYWYKATQALSRVSMVGSAVKDLGAFPP
jgi:hypothetical protein